MAARKLKLFGWVNSEGKLHLPNRFKIEPFLAKIPHGTKVWVEIAQDEEEFIKSHRGYYHGVVKKHVCTAMREVCGYQVSPENSGDLEDVHEWLKNEFLTNWKTIKNLSGETIRMPPSTKRLDDEGWRDFLNKIVQFSAEVWGYEIPRKLPKYVLPEAEHEPKSISHD